MADAVVPDVSPYVGWLATAPPTVQAIAVIGACILAGMIIWRLPSVADAVARVRGKGQTDREVELGQKVVELERKVGSLELLVRHLQDAAEEWDRILDELLPRAQCLVPEGCPAAEAVDTVRRLKAVRAIPTGPQGAND
jgi:hypothetical protein